jgi:hypothetical protein
LGNSQRFEYAHDPSLEQADHWAGQTNNIEGVSQESRIGECC